MNTASQGGVPNVTFKSCMRAGAFRDRHTEVDNGMLYLTGVFAYLEEVFAYLYNNIVLAGFKTVV